MYIMLPDKGEKLGKILSELKVEDLREIPSKCQKLDLVNYEVPFMNIDEELNLKDVLQTLGIKSIFDPFLSNLTNIAEKIYVSKALHKINLEVTEAGSTGAATSAMVLDTKFPDDQFVVNRPFSFFIYHPSSELISFWGIVNLPVPHKIPAKA